MKSIIYKEEHNSFLPAPDWIEIQKIFTSLIMEINEDYELSADLLAINDILEFRLADIDHSIRIDATNDPVTIDFNDSHAPVEIRIVSSVNDFHLYWCHQLNLMPAVVANVIKIEGPIPKIMGLGQVVQSSRKLYIRYYNQISSK